MKRSILSLLFGTIVFVAPQIVSATLLVGYNSFGAATDTTPNEGTSGFDASMVSTGYANFSSLGSNDTFYGPDGGVPLANGATSNGRTEANGATLTVTNTNTQSYTLTSLLFDMASDPLNSAKNFTALTYTIVGVEGGSIFAGDGGTSLKGPIPGNPLATITSPVAVANQVSGTSRNWSDFIADLTSLTLGAGETIIFNWSAGSAVRIDNIALTGTLNAIPEVGSLLALGCLVGSGTMLRTRRRVAPLRMA